MQENTDKVEPKVAVLTIKLENGGFYVGLKNDRFEYYELLGILHRIITSDILIKVAEEENKTNKESNGNTDVTGVTGESEVNAE